MLHSLLLSLFTLGDAFDASQNNNMVVYWGQNSAGGQNTQKSLGYYCQQEGTDIVVLSFLNQFYSTNGYPSTNFGNACEGTYVEGTSLLKCDNIAADIKTCQSLGKKVLLSLGGAAGSYGFTSATQASSFADELWQIFGNGAGDKRPFGDSIIDGFDLDIEGGSSAYYSNFVTRMRENYAKDSSKQYYIAAAPQCPIPDAYLNDAIVGSDIDFLFVQFYNNYCGVNNPASFNFAEWDTLVKTKAKNSNAKIFLGVPAAPSAASTGYTPASDIITLSKSLQSKYPSFGGVMLWDASQAWANNDFSGTVKKGISGSSPAPVVSSSPAISPVATSPVVPVATSSVVPVATSSVVPVVSSSSQANTWWTPEAATSSTASLWAPVVSSSAAAAWSPAATSEAIVAASSLSAATGWNEKKNDQTIAVVTSSPVSTSSEATTTTTMTILTTVTLNGHTYTHVVGETSFAETTSAETTSTETTSAETTSAETTSTESSIASTTSTVSTIEISSTLNASLNNFAYTAAPTVASVAIANTTSAAVTTSAAANTTTAVSSTFAATSVPLNTTTASSSAGFNSSSSDSALVSSLPPLTTTITSSKYLTVSTTPVFNTTNVSSSFENSTIATSRASTHVHSSSVSSISLSTISLSTDELSTATDVATSTLSASSQETPSLVSSTSSAEAAATETKAPIDVTVTDYASPSAHVTPESTSTGFGTVLTRSGKTFTVTIPEIPTQASVETSPEATKSPVETGAAAADTPGEVSIATASPTAQASNATDTSATSSNGSQTVSSSASSQETSTSDPKDGESCPINGELKCSGTAFAVCDHNKWLVRPCGPGTVCIEDEGSLYCGWPQNERRAVLAPAFRA